MLQVNEKKDLDLIKRIITEALKDTSKPFEFAMGPEMFMATASQKG